MDPEGTSRRAPCGLRLHWPHPWPGWEEAGAAPSPHTHRRSWAGHPQGCDAGQDGPGPEPSSRPSPGPAPTTPSPSPPTPLACSCQTQGHPEVFPGVRPGGLGGLPDPGGSSPGPWEQLPDCWGQSCGEAIPQHHRPCDHPRLSPGPPPAQGSFCFTKRNRKNRERAAGWLQRLQSGRGLGQAPTQPQEGGGQRAEGRGQRVSRSRGSTPLPGSRAHPRGSS